MRPYKVLRLRQGSPEWLEYRRTHIGASDAPAIAGESPYSSPYSLWCEKVDGGKEIDPATAHRFRIGHAMEGVARGLYTEQTGLRLRPGRVLESRETPWIFASLDYEAADRIVEAKWTTSSRFDDGLPGDVLVQVTHQMAVSGVRSTDVAVLSPYAFRIFPVAFDEAFWSNILHVEGVFYHEHLMTGIPPAPDGSEATTAALRSQHPEDDGQVIVADADAAIIIRRLLDAKARAAIIEGEIGGMENALRYIMGDASQMVGPGFSVSYKKAKDSVKVDWSAVAQRLLDFHPDLLADYDVAIHAATTTQPGTRRLLVRAEKGVQE